MIATALVVATAVGPVLGIWRPKLIFGMSLGLSLGIYLVFGKLLGVYLPYGKLIDGARMDEALEIEVDAQVGKKMPGLALVVVTPEGITLERAWGLARVSTGAEMTPDIACNWFSLTKPVTATMKHL